MNLSYNPNIFETSTMEAAKRIILTQEGELDSEIRWQQETPYLADIFGKTLSLNSSSVVLDYGCGIGRISKALIERFNCFVLGVDISQNMRSLAPIYVDSSKFSVVSRNILRILSESGFRAHAAISAWVLQHCANPAEDIRLIRDATLAHGRLAVVNSTTRFVPTLEKGWTDDGLDIRGTLRKNFCAIEEFNLDGSVVGKELSETAFFETYEFRKSGTI